MGGWFRGMMPALMSEQHQAPQIPPMCRALRLASIEKGVSQAELARRLGERPTRINRYYTEREPSHTMVKRMEQALDLPSGWLWSHAGYLQSPHTFEEWLALDPQLSDDGRKMLLNMYRQLVSVFQARHGGLLTTAPRPSTNSSRRATS